eukprot:1159722-Pelagomonas_calceolata.AAC.5
MHRCNSKDATSLVNNGQTSDPRKLLHTCVPAIAAGNCCMLAKTGPVGVHKNEQLLQTYGTYTSRCSTCGAAVWASCCFPMEPGPVIVVVLRDNQPLQTNGLCTSCCNTCGAAVRTSCWDTYLWNQGLSLYQASMARLSA